MLAGLDLSQYVSLRDRIFHRIVFVVCQITSRDIYRSGRSVEQLNPAMTFAIVVNEVILVDNQYFINTHGGCAKRTVAIRLFSYLSYSSPVLRIIEAGYHVS